ncbi:ABC transporter ATP-binding protein [Rhodoligotrophos defluvii]|uniref:ABC transporter ATP-binding protein n=1 Tax=Rhodoligotrophos defluvii TaxID=2561934 RepID=UPI0014850821|nr:ABC transporter ATP-binding protein [Rhodoligotrophos defluvii]
MHSPAYAADHLATGSPLLEANNLRIVYDGAIEAVRDVSLSVPERAIVALLGSNGAGKSTVLKAISGVLEIEEGEIESGSIRFAGDSINERSAEQIVRAGLVQVPEGRRLFIDLTVDENLTMGGHLQPGPKLKELRERVFELFPQVAAKRNQIAGYLSGGEQQMVAIGRALMASPRLLALDEPSLGLAPLIVETIYGTIKRMRDEMGVTILLVEQSAAHAFSVADYGYILENGRVVLDGAIDRLMANSEVQEFYLGRSGGGKRKSFRDVKHYKRRKRWLS